MKGIAVLLLAGTLGHCQLPDAPKPDLDKKEKVALAVDASFLLVGDPWSTTQALQRHNHELILPDCISHHPEAMVAYGGIKLALDYWAVREFNKHGHRKLALAVPIISSLVVAPAVIHNFTLQDSYKNRRIEK